jgi:alanine racemase
MSKTISKRVSKNKTYKLKSNPCKINYIPFSDKDIKAEIDVSAIKHNLEYLKKKSGTELMPILKADAYGHGLVDMAKILRKMGIKHIGVATLGEAILLRKSGDKGRVLGWLYDINGPELIDAFNMNIDVAIIDETTIPQFISLIPKNKKIKVTMFVDTGINRAGISYDKAIQAFKDVASCDKIELVGMMSHLICSGIKNSPIVNEQLRKFRELRKNLEEIGIKPPLVHIANTGACMNYDVSDFTLARPGTGMYGITADFKPSKHLQLPMSVKSYIIQTKEVGKGEGIGYDWRFKTPRKMKVCILPIGYADILPRDTSLKLHVYINGTKRKVLGLISMDQIVVESKEEDKISDEAYIFGNGKNCPQTVYDLSKLAKTIPIEILTHTGYRINRAYVNIPKQGLQ